MEVGTRGVLHDVPPEGSTAGLIGACKLEGQTGTVIDVTREGTLIVAPDPPSTVLTICAKPDEFLVLP